MPKSSKDQNILKDLKNVYEVYHMTCTYSGKYFCKLKLISLILKPDSKTLFAENQRAYLLT